jgi:hypothetical protein
VYALRPYYALNIRSRPSSVERERIFPRERIKNIRSRVCFFHESVYFLYALKIYALTLVKEKRDFSLSFSLSSSLFLSLSLCICISVFLSLFLSLSFSFFLFLSLSFSFFLFLSLSFYISLSLSLSLLLSHEVTTISSQS